MTTPRRSQKTAAMRKPKEPDHNRAEILAAGTEEFATRGLKGARMSAIASRTSTTRAMISYYFGKKEALYIAVLENVYRGIREAEKTLQLSELAPLPALRKLVRFTFDYYQSHPEFVALVVAENQAGGRYIRRVHRVSSLNLSIIDTVEALLERGARANVFRRDIDATDLYMSISALGWFQIANRYTFGHIFKRDFVSPEQIHHARDLITGIILNFVLVQGEPADLKDGSTSAKHGLPYERM
jgi:AcrR family transcriptional regulator